MNYFGYGEQDYMPCEANPEHGKCVDVHHIDNNRQNNNISNLIGLCRKCHERAHGTKHFVPKSEFQMIHNSFLLGHRKKYLK